MLTIKRLYSHPEVFTPISFTEGVNIIFGEKSEEDAKTGKKTNGSGKSICLSALDFCLMKNYSASRISRIPDDVLPFDTEIKLDMEVNGKKITISRSKKHNNSPTILMEGNKSFLFRDLEEAKELLKSLMFENVSSIKTPSFRAMFSILSREEKCGFQDIISCYENRQAATELSPHIFLFGLELTLYENIKDSYLELSTLQILKNNLKKKLVTDDGVKDIPKVESEINREEDEVSKIEVALQNIKSEEAYKTIEKDIVRITNNLDKLRIEREAIVSEIEKIKDIGMASESVPKEDIKYIYNLFKDNLGDVISNDIESVISFKEKIDIFKRGLVEDKLKNLQKQRTSLSERINSLDDDFASKMSILNVQDTLKNLKESWNILFDKKQNITNRRYELEEFKATEKKISDTKLGMDIDRGKLSENRFSNYYIIKSFQETLKDLHKYIMGNAEISFDINVTKEKGIYSFPYVYKDKGSNGVNRAAVFMYDVALLFNSFTKRNHPKILIHDGLFDGLEKDSTIACLNALKEATDRGEVFQYIVTINQDSIENANDLKLDINKVRRATFTKAKKFLKKQYTELP